MFLIALLLHVLVGHGADWPQWLGPGRDAVWREEGILRKFPESGLKIRWRSPIRSGYTGPAVADGRVFVMDRKLAPGAKNPENLFKRGSIPGNERILCLDQKTGRVLWQHEYDSDYTVSYPKGPRATPSVSGNLVVCLGAEGDLHCLDTRNGEVQWIRRFKEEFGAKTPTWGFAAHPLLDGDRVISLVGGDGSAVVAFDRQTGQEMWRALTTKDVAYCAPVIYEIGGVRQLIVWLIDAVHSLDPMTGQVYWSHKWGVRGGGSIAIPRLLGDRLFLSTFFNGSLMLRVNGKEQPEQLWISPKITTKDTTFLHALNCVPWLEGEHLYGVCNYGQFRCLQIQDGERVWESLKPVGIEKPRRNANAFIVRHEDRFILCPDSGELVIAKLSPAGYEEIDRTRLIDPTDRDGGRPIVWSHPAFAGRCVFARNDREIICASLAQ